jgi:hypothetical protein
MLDHENVARIWISGPGRSTIQEKRASLALQKKRRGGIAKGT